MGIKAQLEGQDAGNRRIHPLLEVRVALVLLAEELDGLLHVRQLLIPVAGERELREEQHVVPCQKRILSDLPVRELLQLRVIMTAHCGHAQGIGDQYATLFAPGGKFRQGHEVLQLGGQADGRSELADIALKAPIANVRRHQRRSATRPIAGLRTTNHRGERGQLNGA